MCGASLFEHVLSPDCLDIGAPPRYEHLFPMHEIRCEMHQAKTEGGQNAVTLPLKLCGLLCSSSMLSTHVHVHVVVHGPLHAFSVQFCIHTRLQHIVKCWILYLYFLVAYTCTLYVQVVFLLCRPNLWYMYVGNLVAVIHFSRVANFCAKSFSVK